MSFDPSRESHDDASRFARQNKEPFDDELPPQFAPSKKPLPKETVEKIYPSAPLEYDENAAKRAFLYRSFSCPICSANLSIRKEQQGKSMICPDCHSRIEAPTNLDFDKETEYERRYFNAEQKQRDELYSPIRNPNREGIDLKASNSYGLMADTESPDSQRIIFPNAKVVPERVFLCPVCGTRLMVSKRQVGQKIKCPDCFSETVVPSNLDFDAPTASEKQVDAAEKKKRDELYSPLRNPNRIGVNLNSDSIYGISKSEASTSNPPDASNQITMRCRVCESLFQINRSQLGKEVVCKDCGSKMIANDAFAKHLEGLNVRFQPKSYGAYGLDGAETSYEQELSESSTRGRSSFDAGKEARSSTSRPSATPIDKSVERVKSNVETPATQPSAVDSGFQPKTPRVRFRVFRCPHCQTQLSASRSQVGSCVKCPDCDALVRVPTHLDFDTPTDYELSLMRRESAEKQAKTLSPFANPNREGVDMSGSFNLESSSTDASSSAKRDYVTFRCSVCGSLIHAPNALLNQIVTCPDCGTQNVATNSWSEHVDAISVVFQPQKQAPYELGEIPEAPREVFQTKRGEMFFIDPAKKTVAPQPSVNSNRYYDPSAKRVKGANSLVSDVNPSDTLAKAFGAAKAPSNPAIDRAKQRKRRTFFGFMRRMVEKRFATLNENPSEYLPPLVLRRKGDNWVWTRCSPPKRAPLFNGTFLPLRGEELWAQCGFIVLLLLLLAYLMLEFLLPSAMGPRTPDKQFIMCLSILLVGPIFLICCSSVSLYFWSVYNAGTEGARLVPDWRSEDILTSLGSGLRFVLLILIAISPGSALAIGLSRFLDQTTTFGLIRVDLLFYNALIIGSFWLFFPIIWLSSMQDDYVFAPITMRVFKSFKSQFKSWFQFYAFVFAVLFVPTLAWSLIRLQAFWWSLPFILPLCITALGLVLGRLGWILDDETLSADFDD